ncbi:MAG: hypothetical protein PWQ75_1239 [Methanolobus sp.]|jgi:hypothetical protein|uniref:hypothetical protein n=1 Tax=Methanolobus sp. TaxID=1874737 RepID=UPI002585F98C|nr:hypothetical protein [Methanolobus sp.]MDK2831487.1 hypothetical protein [Methanolobus sp.]
MKTRNILIVETILCFFILISLISNVGAVDVDIAGNLPDEAKEGDIIEYDLTITSIPQSADYISFETDLEAYGNYPLYNFTELDITSNSNNYVLDLNDSDEEVLVHIQGKVPVVREVVQTDKVTLIKLDEKTTGYAYYRFNLLDDEKNSLKDSDTRIFTISVPEIESFEGKLDTIEDPFMRNYLSDLFDKGLVHEANELADYLNSDEEEGPEISLYLAVGGIIIALIIGAIIGIRIGNSDDDDYGDDDI